MSSRRRRTVVLAGTLTLSAISAWLGGCGRGEPGAQESASAVPGEMRIEGFDTPESVLHDTVADVYLVSNVAGNPVEKDGNGFISRVSPDGQILERAWISGADDGVTLNAPKGLAIRDGTLYVADIDCLRLFDRASGEHRKDICLEHATFLNDVATSQDGSVFFTDSGLEAGPDGFAPSGADAVYRLIDDDRVVAVKKEPSLGAPNGIAVGSRGIFVVTFGSGEVYRLDAEGNRTDMMPASDRQLDGIVMLPDGGFAMTSWGDSAVYRVGGDGKVTRVMEHLDGPADVGYDVARNRLLVPLFNENAVILRPLG